MSTSIRRTTLSVFFVLTLMLVSTQFSLAYTCACACACAYALVKTRLNRISTVPCKRVAQEEFVRLKSRVDRCNRGLKALGNRTGIITLRLSELKSQAN